MGLGVIGTFFYSVFSQDVCAQEIHSSFFYFFDLFFLRNPFVTAYLGVHQGTLS